MIWARLGTKEQHRSPDLNYNNNNNFILCTKIQKLDSFSRK